MARPIYIRRPDITLVEVQQQAVSVAGVLSNTGTAAILTFIAQTFEIDQERTTEEVNAITSTLRNEVPLRVGAGLFVREMMQRTASDLGNSHGPQLAQAWADSLTATGAYFRVKCTRAGESWEYYTLFTSFREVYNDPPVIGQGIFRPVDNGVAATYS